MRSGMHHLVNVAFHVVASLLLFATFRRATGSRWSSAFVAFVFALHPLHVGSVAWISERKDVLSASFWFLSLYAYVRYAERPTMRRYLFVAAAFCLGLLAKPMVVTLPFVLFLFDVWPLRRAELSRGEFANLVREKVPLFALAAIASCVTYFAQKSTGAVEAIPFPMRMANALVSYVIYIGQTFWPSRLAVIYPYQNSIPAWRPAAAFILLAAITIAAVRLRRKHPYFVVGWLWYLGVLVPVIGLIQVGEQSHADRYTYIPMVGLTIIVAWGAAEFLPKPAFLAASAAACLVCLAISSTQLQYWQNSETLFQHAINVTSNNWIAEYNLGHYLLNVPGRTSDAIAHFQAALRVKPDYADAHNNLGAALMNNGDSPGAIVEFESALKLKPNFPDAEFNLALALSKTPGRAPDAIAHYQAALRLAPDHEDALRNLAVLFVSIGKTSEAIPYLETALRLHPNYRNEHNLGAILSTVPGRQAEAVAHLEAAQRIRPDPQTAAILERLRGGAR
jgi:Tfp pilus assembly protein PilF